MTSISFAQILDHFGIAVSAVGGVLAARGKRIDLFGALVLALVTAFGGGTVRDLLVGDLPVAWLRRPDYLWNASIVALISFFAMQTRQLPRNALLIADALALALFTMIGTRKGYVFNFPAPVCVLLGVVTGVAGGILRDVLTGNVPLVFQPEIHLYATAALCGAIIFMVLLAAGFAELAATAIAIGATFSLRLAGIRWRLTLPVFEPHEPVERP